MSLILAELTKLSRQRGAAFWGFLAIPLLTTIITCALASVGNPGGGIAEIRGARSLLRSLSVAGNPIGQLFYAVGAAAIFAVEYRHAGWRHLVPRRSRGALMAAKFAAWTILCAVSLALVAAGDLFANLILPWLRGSSPVIADWSAAAPGAILLMALLALAELAILGGTVALVTVVTRSAMPAILVPFLAALASAAAQTQFSGAAIPLPAFAADTLRAIVAAPFETRAPQANALTETGILIAWLATMAGLTFALFERQDLTSE
jgi:ABC-2 type transport system permease protein